MKNNWSGASYRLALVILIMGFSGLVAQMVFLRELFIVFSGNELSIGIILANWLILEAFGAFFLGKGVERTRNRIEAFVGLTILFSLSLPVGVYLIRILKNILGISIGEGVGLLPVYFSSFFILLPTSVAHGALFTFACKICSIWKSGASGVSRDSRCPMPSVNEDASSIGRVYVYETVGTLVGGIVWTYLLIPYLHTFHMAVGLATLNLLGCVVLLISRWRTGKLPKALTIISGLLMFSGVSAVFAGATDRLHRLSIKAQWPAQNVVHYQNSIYGNICVVENDGQWIFFLDGVAHLITPVPDIVFIEEFVHLPLLSHHYPERVLILSGGSGGVINEVLKHPSVKLVEYAELDPLILELIRKFPTALTEEELNDKRVKVKHIDGRLFLKMTENKYDVILVGLSEPSDLQTNRFFTKEFYSLAKKKLNAAGILVVGLPGSLTYRSNELRDLNRCVFNTIKSVFPYVRVFPGDGTNLFLASNSAEVDLLDETRLVFRIRERDLKASVVVPRHIQYKLHPGWVDWFREFIEGGTKKINYDFKPLGVFYSVAHWNALFTPFLRASFRWLEKINIGIFLLLCAACFFAFLLIRKMQRTKNKGLNSIPFSIGTTGFAGMIFNLVLIFTFQALYGYVFSWVGLLVSFFMVGVACGAQGITRVLPRLKNETKIFIGIELTIIVFSLLLPLIFLVLQSHLNRTAASLPLKGLFLLLACIGGSLIGAQFPLGNRMALKGGANLSRTAGLLYASDLLGGWLGGVVGGVILLPVMGLLGTCMVVVLLKLSSFIVLTILNKSMPRAKEGMKG